MSFKVSPTLTILKVALAVAVSYAITWGLILLFVDSSALKEPLAPILNFGLAPWGFYYIPFFLCALLVTGETLFNSYIPDDYGDAREATREEIKEMDLLSDEGLILGQSDNFLSPYYIRTNEPLSSFLIAPPGTGKTAAIIVPNLLSCTNSMFINDVKLELWDLTSKQRGRMGKVGLFAPTLNLGKDKSLCFNPFAAECLPRSFADQIDFVDRMISILYPTGEEVSETSRYFNGNAKNLFLFWALRRIVIDGETSLPRIYDDSTSTSDQQAAIAAIMENQSLPEFIRAKGNALLDMDMKEFKSTSTSFTLMLEPFNRPNVRKYFEASDFTYKDFREKKPFSLYVGIPVRDMNRMAPVIKLMAQYLTLELMSDVKLFNRQNVTFMLDEFARLGFVPDLLNAPELSRGCKMNFVFACQSMNQIRKLYNKNGADAMQGLIDVCDYVIIYTQNDSDTALKLSKTIGNTTRKKGSKSRKWGDLTGSSSVSNEAWPFVTDQDLLNMGKNNMIVAVKGFKKRPIVCKKPWYYKSAAMNKLTGAYNDMKLCDDIEHDDTFTHCDEAA
uniref:Type IV secretion system protein VirD4 n=2 Tax=Vibrionaceae TaxID=641 RepID=A0A0H3ZSR5_VIBSP|nr:Type IV secretion system protein VirD4 [Vibrio splendidus]AKN40553.1 conjugal transfer protein (traG) [Enterovibrio norvegicus]